MRTEHRIWRFFLIAVLLAASLLTPGAYAEEEAAPAEVARAPETIAIYAAAGAQPEEGGALSVIIRCVFDDGTYRQYIMQGERWEIDSQGRISPEEAPGAEFIQLYPRQEETALLPAMHAGAGTSAPGGEGAGTTFDEGTQTRITIADYTEYSGDAADYFLSAGDKVAVISPSALPNWEQTAATAEGLRSWGFEPVFGRHIYDEVRTLEECLEDFRWALEDPEIKAIFCVRGGYGATEVMDAVPDGLIAAARKPIVGYSDITAYHAAWTLAGLPSIHGCMSAAFSDLPEECALAERQMMAGTFPVYECEADARGKDGTAEGILIGGNLSTFTATLDTAYDSTVLNRPYILFLEEVGENMQHIHRYLTILKHRGILDNAAGIVFGEWTMLPADGLGNYGEARGGLFESVADMITRQFLDGVDVPVAFGFPAGHGENNYPLLMGAPAKLEVSENRYTLSWPEAENAPEEASQDTESGLEQGDL